MKKVATKKKKSNVVAMPVQQQIQVVQAPTGKITLEQIAISVLKKYKVAAEMVRGVCEKKLPGVIIAGERGLGKSWTVQSILDAFDDIRTIVKYSGHISPLTLHNKLAEFKEEDCVLWFDDCDSVFTEKDAMNTLKAALDTLPKRLVSWASMSKLVSEQEFEFKGRIIITTNVQLTKSPHLAAFLDRIHWYGMNLTLDEKMYKIEQIALGYPGATPEVSKEVVSWLKQNKSTIGSLMSLRTFVKCVQLANFSTEWKELAEQFVQQQAEVSKEETNKPVTTGEPKKTRKTKASTSAKKSAFGNYREGTLIWLLYNVLQDGKNHTVTQLCKQFKVEEASLLSRVSAISRHAKDTGKWAVENDGSTVALVQH